MIATYQTRIVGYVGLDHTAGDAALDAYGELCGRVQRKLFADAAAGGSELLLKSEYLKCYGIPARMFNAVRVSLQGKVASVRESQKVRVSDLQRRINRAKKQIAKAKKRGQLDQAHHKCRRLANFGPSAKVAKS